MSPGQQVSNRWNDRRVLAAVVGLGIFLVPIVCSVSAVLLAEHFIAEPSYALGFALWWAGVLAVATVVFLGAERLARRALPLAVLLKMGLLFPDQAPKRLAVARRVASTRDLHRRIQEARDLGRADQPAAAAEKIVELAVSLSAHDPATRGHSERVRAYTDMIADELHLSRADRDRLRWSALLHDIGKLAIHPEILNKPGSLSPAEWQVMRRHPLVGAQLIAPMAEWLGPWASTVAEHHERFDGAGYPFGLAANQISLGGRIVAVSDAYDVMTSVRAYTKPRGAEAARQELASQAGRQFDPQVVRAFLGVSMWRLRSAAPLSWLASMTAGNVAQSLARVGVSTSHVALSGLVASASVMGLAVTSAHAATPSAPAPVAAPASGQTPAHETAAPASGTLPATTTTTRPPGTTTTTAATKSTTRSTNAPPTTTTAPESTTTTTAPESTTTTTLAAAPVTTTQPPTAAVTGLSASASCALVQFQGKVTLNWTASVTAGVTGYQILRSSGGAFSEIATVNGRTTTSYVDRSGLGLDNTFSYEIVSVAPTGNATSAPASATTPKFCL
jgi:putative nucleotidyltransferase with HDIG domain